PSLLRIDRDAQVDLEIPGHAGHARRGRPPTRVAKHRVVEFARRALVSEDSRPGQLPAISPPHELSQLVAGHIEPAPKDRIRHRRARCTFRAARALAAGGAVIRPRVAVARPCWSASATSRHDTLPASLSHERRRPGCELLQPRLYGARCGRSPLCPT